MASLIRFKKKEIDSSIRFTGIKKRRLDYTIRSLALIPDIKTDKVRIIFPDIPEIFWQ